MAKPSKDSGKNKNKIYRDSNPRLLTSVTVILNRETEGVETEPQHVWETRKIIHTRVINTTNHFCPAFRSIQFKAKKHNGQKYFIFVSSD